ncbi:hypothetical protein NCC78_21520 [Micromonospora phytophila]|uniref:hypothetical protein n=1 Tax=Micromonospora phytophila TaxID=709888 RepID=UPI00202E157D|nr:hypothetical protein [Micromonospora phytophila]MCM0677246.1 hypothetical protein [Micromonospora phytophila]
MQHDPVVAEQLVEALPVPVELGWIVVPEAVIFNGDFQLGPCEIDAGHEPSGACDDVLCHRPRQTGRDETYSKSGLGQRFRAGVRHAHRLRELPPAPLATVRGRYRSRSARLTAPT